MLPCPSNNFSIPQHPDPLCDNILTTLGGHLNVHSFSISLIGGGHVHISHPVLELAYFIFLLLHGPLESVDAVVGVTF